MAQNRFYSSTAQRTTLNGSITNSATSIVVNAVTGFPVSYPYTLILERDTVNEEVVKVTAAAGVTLTVVRGQDGTAGVSHANGAVVEHGVSAQDFTEPQAHIAASAAVHGLAGTVVGTTDAQTLTNKTVALGANAVSGTTAQFNTALSDNDFATLAGAETLTNKTLASPTFSGTATGASFTGATLDAASTVGGVSGTTLAAVQAAWTAWTPAWTGFTLGNGTVDVARYKQIGKVVHVRVRVTLGSTSSFSGQAKLTLPVAPFDGTAQVVEGSLRYFDFSAGQSYLGFVSIESTTQAFLYTYSAPSTTQVGANPMTGTPAPGASDVLTFALTYEAA